MTVYSDLAWSPERRVALRAGRSTPADVSDPDAEVTTRWETPYLGDLVLVPSADPKDAHVTIIMGVTRDPTGCRVDAAEGCIVARRRVSFVSHKTLTLPVTLYATCIGVPCDDNTTCSVLGRCVPADVPADACESSTGCFLAGEAPPSGFVTPSGAAAGAPATPTGVSVNAVPIKAVVSTLAGSGVWGSGDGMATAASFALPIGIAIDPTGNLTVIDGETALIRRITSAGAVTTLAGSNTNLNGPWGVGVDGAGNIFVADTLNYRIQKFTPSGVASTLAGGSTKGFADGAGAAAQFNVPTGIAVDGKGTVFVADENNERIRAISTAGIVTTLAGSGANGFADGVGAAAAFSSPTGLALDGAGNLVVADANNHRIRRVDASGAVTTIAGSGTAAFADGVGSAASFSAPGAVAVDAAGDAFVADTRNHSIRLITSAGVVSTLAGSGVPGFADGTGMAASFSAPSGIAVDAAGTVYVADADNNRIRKVLVVGHGELVVSWSAPASGPPSTEYTATAEANGQPTRSCTTPSTSCTIRLLASGMPYAISVIAKSTAGVSAPSDKVTATPN